MVCPPVREDIPRALASGLNAMQADKPRKLVHYLLVQTDKPRYNLLYHRHQCSPTSGSVYLAVTYFCDSDGNGKRG